MCRKFFKHYKLRYLYSYPPVLYWDENRVTSEAQRWMLHWIPCQKNPIKLLNAKSIECISLLLEIFNLYPINRKQRKKIILTMTICQNPDTDDRQYKLHGFINWNLISFKYIKWNLYDNKTHLVHLMFNLRFKTTIACDL